MKTKTLVIGAIAAATVFAGGWAVAQSVGTRRLRSSVHAWQRP